MKLKKVQVGGTTYTIKKVNLIADDSTIFGEVNYVNKIILIKKGMTEDYMLQTLIHEILHAIVEELHLQQEENFVKPAASMLFQALTGMGLINLDKK